MGHAIDYRQDRTGAQSAKRPREGFWVRQLHPTAIESNDHCWQYIVYVDLNMVRVGVVVHPSSRYVNDIYQAGSPLVC